MSDQDNARQAPDSQAPDKGQFTQRVRKPEKPALRNPGYEEDIREWNEYHQGDYGINVTPELHNLAVAFITAQASYGRDHTPEQKQELGELRTKIFELQNELNPTWKHENGLTLGKDHIVHVNKLKKGAVELAKSMEIYMAELADRVGAKYKTPLIGKGYLPPERQQGNPDLWC